MPAAKPSASRRKANKPLAAAKRSGSRHGQPKPISNAERRRKIIEALDAARQIVLRSGTPLLTGDEINEMIARNRGEWPQEHLSDDPGHPACPSNQFPTET